MQIETGIPAPTRNRWKANLDNMQINQSAKIPMRFYNSVKVAVSMHFHKRTGKVFTTEKQSDKFFRIWRIK